jgi:mRNA-degrading endonuclease toxin of MazEF toxin-antitoxin module
MIMSRYQNGDVILVSIAIDARSDAKIRPAVVVRTADDRDLEVCPISSKPATDTPCIPISLGDFSDGGLDLFSESYVLTSRVRRIPFGKVAGKRGRLTEETTTAVLARVTQSQLPYSGGTKNNRHPGARK